jgi:KDO2-lipid IV(A) lauroyltransferase
MGKRIWNWVVRGAFRFFQKLWRIVPPGAAARFGEALGVVAYTVSARYRGVADKNLRIAYGDTLTAAQRRDISKRVFKNFARATLVEFLRPPPIPVGASDFAPIHEVLKRGRGVIVVSAHLGNWELVARRGANENLDVLVIARPTQDPQLNRLIDGLREKSGYRVHPRGGSPRVLLRHLRSNGLLAILVDQKSDDVFVPFFGKVAGTTAGPAVLALKTGAPIVPMFCPRKPDGAYSVEICPEIDTTATGDTDADVNRIMTDITLAVESAVRKYPDQWLWLHDRWLIRNPEKASVSFSSGKRLQSGEGL